MSRSCPGSFAKCWRTPGCHIARRRCGRRDRRPGPDRRSDGRAAAGKGLALAAGKPLIAVNHLEGHALSPRLVDPDLGFPYLLLLVSGGHCQLLEVRGRRRIPAACDHHRRCRRGSIRQGREAARPRLSRRSGDRGAGAPGRSAAVPLPRPLVGSGEPHFSFAGLKSAVQRAVASGEHRPEDVAASFQQAVVDCLVDRTASARFRQRCARRWSSPAGSRRTSAIRDALAELARRLRAARFSVPPGWLCTDNAAMIAWAGVERLAAGLRDASTRRRGRAGRSTRARRKSAAQG